MIYINSSGTKEMFTGAYEKRVEQQSLRTLANGKRTSLREYKGEGVTITISEESKQFMEGVAERKAAQLAAQKEIEEECPENVFAGTGDFKQQYLVFSENLYNRGFYDSISDDEVKKMEGMLKDITWGMDSINRGGLRSSRDTEMSHEAAKLDLISSVNALHCFAENYVPKEMQESFKTLIDQYKEYNNARVLVHRNMSDIHDEGMKNMPAPNAVHMSETAKAAWAQTKAGIEIGRVSHTDEEEVKNRQDYQALFESLANGRENINSVFDQLKNTFISFASGGSKNPDVLAMLNSRNEGSIDRMFDYWSKVL